MEACLKYDGIFFVFIQSVSNCRIIGVMKLIVLNTDIGKKSSIEDELVCLIRVEISSSVGYQKLDSWVQSVSG